MPERCKEDSRGKSQAQSRKNPVIWRKLSQILLFLLFLTVMKKIIACIFTIIFLFILAAKLLV
jgi:hypothetical protein